MRLGIAANPPHQRFLREAESHRLLRPDVQQYLTVQKLAEAAQAGEWSEQELQDAICAALATNPEQLERLQQLGRDLARKEAYSRTHIEGSSAAGSGAMPPLSVQKPKSVARRALGWLGQRRGFVAGVLAVGLVGFGAKRLYDSWKLATQPAAGVKGTDPPPPKPEPTRPDSQYVKRPLGLQKQTPISTTQQVPLKLKPLATQEVIWLGLGALLIAMAGWLLARTWPHLRRRLLAMEAQRQAEEEARQTADAEKKKEEAAKLSRAKAKYAELEREAFKVGMSIRPEYRIALQPALPAMVLDDTATMLGRIYQGSPGSRLDVEGTLQKTLRTGGRPSPVMLPRRRAVELLVIYDEWETRPYVPAFLKLLDRWEKLGVQLQRWRIQKNDPGRLESPNRSHQTDLEGLLNQHEGAPVVLFASRLHIQGQDEYRPWPYHLRVAELKVWLDPDPRLPSQRLREEQAAIERLSVQLPRFGMTVEGVLAMARYLQQQGKGVRIPDWEPLKVTQQTELALGKWMACGVQVPDCSYEQFEAARQEYFQTELSDPRSIRLLMDWFEEEFASEYRAHQETVQVGEGRKEELKRWLKQIDPELMGAWNQALAEQLVVDKDEDPERPPNLRTVERLKREVGYRHAAAVAKGDVEGALQQAARLDETALHEYGQQLRREAREELGMPAVSVAPRPRVGWKEAQGARLLGASGAWAVVTVGIVLWVVQWGVSRQIEWMDRQVRQEVTVERMTDYEVVNEPLRIVHLGTSSQKSLRIALGEPIAAERELSRAAQALKPLLGRIGAHLTVDEEQEVPTHLLRHGQPGWRLVTLQDNGAVELGKQLTTQALLGRLPLSAVLMVDWPLDADQAKRLSDDLLSQGIQLVSDGETHDYVVRGRYESPARFALVQPTASERKTMPRRSDWVMAGDLAGQARKLMRLFRWLTLESQSEDKRDFPYRLEVADLNVPGRVLQEGDTTYNGERYLLRLVHPEETPRRTVEPRYVYVCSVDSNGSMALLFGTGGDKNRVPLENYTLPKMDLMTIHPSGKSSTDTFVLLTSSQPLSEPDKLCTAEAHLATCAASTDAMLCALLQGSLIQGIDQNIQAGRWSVERITVTHQEHR